MTKKSSKKHTADIQPETRPDAVQTDSDTVETATVVEGAFEITPRSTRPESPEIEATTITADEDTLIRSELSPDETENASAEVSTPSDNEYEQAAITPATDARLQRRDLLGLVRLRLSHNRLASVLALVGAVCGLTLIVGGATYAHQPILVHTPVKQSFDKPIEISFSRPVQQTIQYRLSDTPKGTWRAQGSFRTISKLIFTPEKDFSPGTHLTLRLVALRPALNLASGTRETQSITIVIESAGKLTQISPKPNEKNVDIRREIQLTLDARNRGLRKLCIEGDVPVQKPCMPISFDDKTFRWPLEHNLDQTRSYTVTIIDQNQSAKNRVLKTLSFQTVAEPQVQSSFSGFLRPGDAIELLFDREMQAADTKVNFDMPGSGAWTDDRKYTFKTGAVVPGRTYAYTVGEGSQSKAGGTMTTQKTFSVSTPGQVQVIAARPTGNRVALDASISLTFDQPVDRASAEAAFSVTPSVPGTFSWSGNTMTYKPVGFPHQTGYTVSLASGVKPVFGLLGRMYTYQFVSDYETKKLNVPRYLQTHSLSCEAASLRMALAYYGIYSNDDEILGRIGYSPQARNTETNTWQDPYQMFVGSVDGKISVDGWGVLSGPVASAARSFGRGAQALSGVSAEKVAAEIYAGHPVVIWGISGSRPVMDSWNTPTNGVVSVPRNAHVRTVVGVDGSAENPVGFYLHDPLKSAPVYMSADQLRANSAGNGGHAVIVY